MKVQRISLFRRVKNLGHLMWQAFKLLKRNDPLRMAGATSFFATFALPPILIIFTQIFRLFVDPTQLSSELIERLGNLLGSKSAAQVERTLDAVLGLSHDWYVTLFGFIFLLFVATTVFEVIKDSMAQIWEIRVRPHSGFVFRLKNRLRSLIIITLAGLLFLTGLFMEGFQVVLGDYVNELWKGSRILFNQIVNEVFFGLIVSIWFTSLFRFLTTGRPKFKTALSGGVFTAILFTAGKSILIYFLSASNLSSIYGASGSTILIMLFVFYSSMIFYYGACFVKVLSEEFDNPILPVKQAFRVETREKPEPS